jgi:signal recognition particle subunit SRP54
MFESLTDRFEGIFTKLRGKGKLSEADVDEVLREIRLALLEADVNLSVVKTLQGRIRERAVGEELSGALNPAQQVVKIVNEELTATLGGEAIRIAFASKPPTVVLMAGLQGSGKTTNSAKLARWFKAQGRQPMLVGADLQRHRRQWRSCARWPPRWTCRCTRHRTTWLPPAPATRWRSRPVRSPRPAEPGAT